MSDTDQEAGKKVISVLGVDDTSAALMVLETLALSCGYTFRSASNGFEAMEILDEWIPDVILCDVMMPGMTGFEVTEKVRADERLVLIPIVLVTALDRAEDRVRGIEAGADDFLTKPFNKSELVARIESTVKTKRLHETIRDQRDELARVQQQKDQLSSLIVHDLKGPLSGILLNAQLMAECPELSDDDQLTCADILSAAEQMHRMVINLLDISKSEDGKLDAHCSEFELEPMLDEIVRATRPRAKLQKQTIALNFDESARVVCADKDLVRRLVDNLIDNALKYTPDAGEITVEAEAANDRLSLRVRDMGPGIPEAMRQRVFERYARMDRDLNREAATSRGLGLTFCKLAAEAHDGEIWVEGNDPQGSVFCVSLPGNKAA